jgi:hypothetical protein
MSKERGHNVPYAYLRSIFRLLRPDHPPRDFVIGNFLLFRENPISTHMGVLCPSHTDRTIHIPYLGIVSKTISDE